MPFVPRGNSTDSGGDGTSFTPSQSNLYDPVKAIFHPSTNPGVAADDQNRRLNVGAVAQQFGALRLNTRWSHNIPLSSANVLTRSTVTQATLANPGAGEIWAAHITVGDRRTPLGFFLAADLEAKTAVANAAPTDANSLRFVVKASGTPVEYFLSKTSERHPLLASTDAALDGTPLTISRLEAQASESDGGSVQWNAIVGRPNFAAIATSGAYSDLIGAPAVPARARTTEADAVAATGTGLSASLDSRTSLDDARFVTVRIVMRILQRVLKSASSTLRGAVLLARNADVDASETDTSRVPTVALAKRLVERLVPAVFRAGNTDRIPLDKLPELDDSLIEKVYDDTVAANAAIITVDGVTVENDANQAYYLRVGATSEFTLGSALFAATSSTAITVEGVRFYALGNALRIGPTGTAKDVTVWKVDDLAAIRATIQQAITQPATWARDGNTDDVPEPKIPPEIARASAVADSLTGLDIAGTVLEGTRRSGSNPIELALPIGHGLGTVGSWKPSANIASAETNVATGIMLPDNPDDDAIFVFVTAYATVEPVVRAVRGSTLKALSVSTAGSGGQDTSIAQVEVDGEPSVYLYADRTAAGELLLSHDRESSGANTGFEALHDFFALYELTDQASDDDDPADGGLTFYQHWTDTPLDGSPAFAATPITRNTVIAANAEYTQVLLNSSLMAGADLAAPIFIAYSGQIGFDVQRGAGESGRTVVLIELGYRLFPGTANQVTFWRQWTDEFGANAHFTVPLVAFETHSTFPEGPYPTDGGGTLQVTQALFDNPVPFNLELRVRGFDEGTTDFTVAASRAVVDIDRLVSRDLAFSVYQLGRLEAPPVKPSISLFSLAGDLSPAAGAINETYDYSFAVAQSSHLSALRIVRFDGTDASPSAVTVLANIDAADFHGGDGQITVSGFNLAAGETETVRLEGYEQGQTPATDQPVSYHDVRITAHAAAAQTRFIRVPRTVGSPAARPTAATLAAALAETGAGVIATAGTVIGDWEVSGIPNTGDWLVGWIVPQSAAQPSHYSQAGIRIDSAVAARFAFTENSVDHYVYLFADSNYVDDSYNGSTIQVS